MIAGYSLRSRGGAARFRRDRKKVVLVAEGQPGSSPRHVRLMICV